MIFCFLFSVFFVFVFLFFLSSSRCGRQIASAALIALAGRARRLKFGASFVIFGRLFLIAVSCVGRRRLFFLRSGGELLQGKIICCCFE